VATLANANRLPDPVPVASGTVTIQVLNSRGRIVDASPGADRLVPLLPAATAARYARDGAAALLDGRPFGLPDTIRVVATSTRGGGTVIAAVSYDQVAQSLATVRGALLFGTPLLLLVLAGAIWLIVGTTLRPVADLRRGAEEVTRTGRPRALAVPAARDEVRSLALTLNDMLSRLGAAQERQRWLVSDTAHELRSPIASIRAQLEVAIDHPESQDWRQTASDVLADTLRLANLTEDLLVLARLDEGGPRRPPRKPVDLKDLAQQEVARRDGGRVPVSVVPGGGPHTVSGDADGLRRMLGNLIDNAVRYAGSKVEVGVSADGACVRLTVTDDGPGIPAADIERAFGRFTRLDPARSRGTDTEAEAAGGSGLGLAIVRAIAQAHGGAAQLEDAQPGLRAVVLLPAVSPTKIPRAAAR
jgi:signal transduction histidine kinase